MKKLTLLVSFLLITIIKSQTISDYKYILIPSEFADFTDSRSFGLDKILENSLREKKYIILSETKSNWPAEALSNPCAVINAAVLNDKSMFRNKIILQFTDCNNQVLVTKKGSSIIKEFEPGFQDALKKALLDVPFSNQKLKLENIAQTEQKMTAEDKTSTPNDVVSAPVQTVQKYSNGKLNLQKIVIDETQFMLIDGNSSVPFATFKSTAKKDVYRVKLRSGEATIGYYENGNIIIEMPKTNGEFANEVFVAN